MTEKGYYCRECASSEHALGLKSAYKDRAFFKVTNYDRVCPANRVVVFKDSLDAKGPPYAMKPWANTAPPPVGTEPWPIQVPILDTGTGREYYIPGLKPRLNFVQPCAQKYQISPATGLSCDSQPGYQYGWTAPQPSTPTATASDYIQS